MLIIKRLGPMSCAKLSAVFNVIFGLIMGFFISMGALMSAAVGFGESSGGPFAALFGVGAIILFPIFYGIVGFIAGFIGAWIYNLVAGWVGGIEIEFDQRFSAPPGQAT